MRPRRGGGITALDLPTPALHWVTWVQAAVCSTQGSQVFEDSFPVASPELSFILAEHLLLQLSLPQRSVSGEDTGSLQPSDCGVQSSCRHPGLIVPQRAEWICHLPAPWSLSVWPDTHPLFSTVSCQLKHRLVPAADPGILDVSVGFSRQVRNVSFGHATFCFDPSGDPVLLLRSLLPPPPVGV